MPHLFRDIDLYNSQTIEDTLGLVYHKQCWSMGLDFTQTATDTRFMLNSHWPVSTSRINK